MAVNRNPIGPLRSTNIAQFQDVLFWKTTDPPTIDPADTDIPYVVKIADRIDLLASAYLGSEHLVWVILERNNLRLTPNDLVPGRTIFIPTRDSLVNRGIL